MLTHNRRERKDQESQVESQNGGSWSGRQIESCYLSFFFFLSSLFAGYTHVRRSGVFKWGWFYAEKHFFEGSFGKGSCSGRTIWATMG